jgi:hypothetical protein
MCDPGSHGLISGNLHGPLCSTHHAIAQCVLIGENILVIKRGEREVSNTYGHSSESLLLQRLWNPDARSYWIAQNVL